MALELGWYNVDAMLASAPARQLDEWQEFHDLEPFGKSWHRTSLSTARTLNTVMSLAPVEKGEKREYYEDADFVPSIDHAKKRDEELQAQIDAANEIEGFGV